MFKNDWHRTLANFSSLQLAFTFKDHLGIQVGERQCLPSDPTVLWETPTQKKRDKLGPHRWARTGVLNKEWKLGFKHQKEKQFVHKICYCCGVFIFSVMYFFISLSFFWFCSGVTPGRATPMIGDHSRSCDARNGNLSPHAHSLLSPHLFYSLHTLSIKFTPQTI